MTILDPSKPLSFKIFKPVKDVSQDEVVEGLENLVRNGGKAPEHLTT